MADTLILIVDKLDNPLGSTTKQHIHEAGLYHRLSRVMLDDGKNNILLQRRSHKSGYYPNCWDSSAAGYVDENENYLQAAKRELMEEIGIEGITLTEIGYYQKTTIYKGKVLNRFNKFYKSTVSHQTNFLLQEDEVDEVRWFSPDELKSLIKKNESVAEPLAELYKRYYS